MKLYNTLLREKTEFVPLIPGHVRMYSCGPTVYNYFHIGNARPFIVFDAMRHYFEYQGLNVTFVQNFTDVEDKMIVKAREEGITVKELGERFIAEYQKDAAALSIAPPTHAPRATETIQEIINMVRVLEEKGFAYEVDGNVYFATKKFSQYGKLSHQPLDDLEAGARIDIGEEKREPMDFALWKKRKEDDEIAWDSPWGMGRPGWHIECSAMAKKFLGDSIDIHSGGQDLIFPHHENEIAQSECANGCAFANFWVHNGYINIENKKMSKSAGNFFTIRDILAQGFSGEVVRFFMLSAHYRSPINFSFDLLKQAETGLERIKTCVRNLEFALNNSARDDSNSIPPVIDFARYKAEFLAGLDDDFNTAIAISKLFELVRDINTIIDGAPRETLQNALNSLLELCAILRILQESSEEKATGGSEIQPLIAEREAARKAKNFARADEIRAQLSEMGVTIEDTPNGTRII